MSEEPKMCENCGCYMTVVNGVLTCPKCDVKRDTPTGHTPEIFSSRSIFWLALLLPALFSLVSFLMGQGSKDLRDAAVMVGFAGLFVGAGTSIYCGLWLAFRCSNKIGVRVPIALFFIPAIAVVNLVIIFAGCASNATF
jgi:hypothetical protein